MPLTTEELSKFRESYLRMSDPSEYYFVIQYIGTWEHWEDLCSNSQFKPIIESWRRELEAKIKSDSLARIIDAAKGETRDALQANKFLLDVPWIKEDTKRGRPSRNEIMSEIKQIAQNEQRIAEDYKRISTDEILNKDNQLI